MAYLTAAKNDSIFNDLQNRPRATIPTKELLMKKQIFFCILPPLSLQSFFRLNAGLIIIHLKILSTKQDKESK